MKDRKKDLEELLAHSIELQRQQQLLPLEKVNTSTYCQLKTSYYGIGSKFFSFYFLQGKVEHLASAWKTLDGQLRESLQPTMSPWTHQQYVVPAAVQMVSLTSEDPHIRAQDTPDSVRPTDLNQRATELADWLILVTQMLKSNIVTVGDTNEIRTVIGRLQVRNHRGE